jgi:hypothetical protein
MSSRINSAPGAREAAPRAVPTDASLDAEHAERAEYGGVGASMQNSAEMRRYFAEQRGNALIRVGPWHWMFGSGN